MAEFLTSDSIRVAAIVPETTAEGPGTRFAIWVQGCTLQCPGCFNPHLWGRRGGELLSPRALAEQALASGSQGVTFLGGEPAEQASALSKLARMVRDGGMSVMTFSGYSRDELLDVPGAQDLIEASDLLVTGRYVRALPDLVRPWVGSTNQVIEFLTDRYRHLESSVGEIRDRLEIRVSADGRVAVNGWANTEMLDVLLDDPEFDFRRMSSRSARGELS